MRNRVKAVPLEKEIQGQILQFLRLMKVFSWRQNSGAMKGEATATTARRFIKFASVDGLSDIIGLLPPKGRFLAIEVKRPGQRPTDKQAEFIDEVNRNGGLAFVATSVKDVEESLKLEGYSWW